MNGLQRRIVDNIESVSGRHDDPAVYGGPAGDPGLCEPDSVSWKINSDLASVGRAGTAAIVMELLHPSVMAGVQQLSSYREDPFRRARTTLGSIGWYRSNLRRSGAEVPEAGPAAKTPTAKKGKRRAAGEGRR